jgi:hypothetical protein
MPTPPADTAIGNLFGEPELPAGFRYMPEVLSPAEEKGLVQRLEKLPLKPFEFHGSATVASTALGTDIFLRARRLALTRASPTTFGR